MYTTGTSERTAQIIYSSVWYGEAMFQIW